MTDLDLLPDEFWELLNMGSVFAIIIFVDAIQDTAPAVESCDFPSPLLQRRELWQSRFGFRASGTSPWRWEIRCKDVSSAALFVFRISGAGYVCGVLARSRRNCRAPTTKTTTVVGTISILLPPRAPRRPPYVRTIIERNTDTLLEFHARLVH